MKTTNSEKKVKLAVAQASESIRNKFKQIHDDRKESYRLLEEQYHPITKKLNALIDVNASEQPSRPPPPHPPGNRNVHDQEEEPGAVASDLRRSTIKFIHNRKQKRQVETKRRKTPVRRVIQQQQQQLHLNNDADDSIDISDIDEVALASNKRSREHSEIDDDLQPKKSKLNPDLIRARLIRRR